MRNSKGFNEGKGPSAWHAAGPAAEPCPKSTSDFNFNRKGSHQTLIGVHFAGEWFAQWSAGKRDRYLRYPSRFSL